MSLVRFRSWAFSFTLIILKYGVLAQSVEHLTFNQVVRGSNPRCLRYIKKEVLKISASFFVLMSQMCYNGNVYMRFKPKDHVRSDEDAEG